jgi:hypothetical protein
VPEWERGGVMKYRKKPVVIDAIKWDGSKSAMEELTSLGLVGTYNISDKGIYTAIAIRTLEGTMTGVIGDWIIKGIKGEFYPIKDSIFRETYEAV